VPWHATAAHDAAGINAHGACVMWHASKARPSTAEMLAKPRSVLIAAKFRASHHGRRTPEEIKRHPPGLAGRSGITPKLG
jgi:hypothetical protein